MARDKDAPKTVEEFDNAVGFILRWACGTESVQPPLPLDVEDAQAA